MIGKTLEKRVEANFEQDYRETFMERIERLFEAEELFKEERGAIQYGLTLKHILEGVTPVFTEGEKIVGNVKTRIPSDEEQARVLEHYKKWWDIPVEERHRKIFFYYSEGWLKCRPDWFYSFGHLALDWEELIELGLGGLCEKAQKELEKRTDENQKIFLEGIILSYHAISDYIKKVANATRERGDEDLARALEQIASGPATSFVEALQLIWLVALIAQKVCGCGVLNYSRMDQYLYPYYSKDLEQGKLTKEEALDVLLEFYFKNNEIMVHTDHMSQEIESTQYTLEVAYDDPNYLILAGKCADGSGGVNALSFLMVEAARLLKLRNPFIVVRYYSGMDEEFWRQVCDAMRQNTTIVIYNDETMVPALKYFGVEEPEVYDYGFYGCNDPNIPAYEGGLRQVWINLCRPIELALHQGDYPLEPLTTKNAKTCQFPIEDRMTGVMTGPYYGIKTKAPWEMETMEEFLEAVEAQLTYLIGEYRRGFEEDFLVEQKLSKDIMRIEDCFLKGTVEEATTWAIGGTKYHKIVTQGSGIATAVNILYAIEQIVFKDKTMTLPELAEVMAKDYEGNEILAETFKRKIPKFGNDMDEVDKYAGVMTELFIRAIEKHNGEKYLYQMWPTYSTDRDFTGQGWVVGATPDGRRARQPLSENQSAAEGTDVEGLTALLNSVAKMKFEKITGGPLNLRIHPTAVAGEEGLDVLCALFKTYMENGGLQLQINVVDAKTLKKAQKNPEKYKTLCVRVTGYSAFFIEMGKQAQEEMIRRTEQIR